ncbi:MAG: hypothetical protein B0D92_07625 [Spirochaeta sp. LUC14_002_19_P3]|nr:MAG: hypothetical protein B0D92_07625 [Spirochaeta sp. LUC14_002_19_P3]
MTNGLQPQYSGTGRINPANEKLIRKGKTGNRKAPDLSPEDYDATREQFFQDNREAIEGLLSLGQDV